MSHSDKWIDEDHWVAEIYDLKKTLTVRISVTQMKGQDLKEFVKKIKNDQIDFERYNPDIIEDENNYLITQWHFPKIGKDIYAFDHGPIKKFVEDNVKKYVFDAAQEVKVIE